MVGCGENDRGISECTVFGCVETGCDRMDCAGVGDGTKVCGATSCGSGEGGVGDGSGSSGSRASIASIIAEAVCHRSAGRTASPLSKASSQCPGMLTSAVGNISSSSSIRDGASGGIRPVTAR